MKLAPREKDKLILKYMFIVYRLTNKYKHGLSYDEIDDLIIDCMMGLSRAIDAFDDEKGYTLEALATKYIRGEIANYFKGRNTEVFNQNYNSLYGDEECEIESAFNWSRDYYLTIDIMRDKGIISREDVSLIFDLAHGYTYAEIGKRSGVTRQWIGYKVNKIRAKIAKANALPVDNKISHGISWDVVSHILETK